MLLAVIKMTGPRTTVRPVRPREQSKQKTLLFSFTEPHGSAPCQTVPPPHSAGQMGWQICQSSLENKLGLKDKTLKQIKAIPLPPIQPNEGKKITFYFLLPEYRLDFQDHRIGSDSLVGKWVSIRNNRGNANFWRTDTISTSLTITNLCKLFTESHDLGEVFPSVSALSWDTERMDMSIPDIWNHHC